MNVKECFDIIDRLKPNACSEDLKYMWLNDVEKDIFDNVIMRARPPKRPDYTGEKTEDLKDEKTAFKHSAHKSVSPEKGPDDAFSQYENTLNERKRLKFIPFVEGKDEGRKLIAQKPYETIYVYYLCAMIDYWNNELNGYQNNMTLYNERYAAFAAEYRRKRMPKYSGRIKGL